MHERFSKRPWGALAAAWIMATACSGGTEPDVLDYSGVWEGLTGSNRDVRMVVGSAGTIDSLSIRVRLTLGGGTCTGPLLLDGPVSIQGNSFTASTYFPGSTIVSQVQGTFSSATSMSGTYQGQSGSFSLLCGSSFSVGTGSLLSAGTFQATRH